jgi:hypothetical protein
MVINTQGISLAIRFHSLRNPILALINQALCQTKIGGTIYLPYELTGLRAYFQVIYQWYTTKMAIFHQWISVRSSHDPTRRRNVWRAPGVRGMWLCWGLGEWNSSTKWNCELYWLHPELKWIIRFKENHDGPSISWRFRKIGESHVFFANFSLRPIRWLVNLPNRHGHQPVKLNMTIMDMLEVWAGSHFPSLVPFQTIIRTD